MRFGQDFATVCISNRLSLGFGGPWLVTCRPLFLEGSLWKIEIEIDIILHCDAAYFNFCRHSQLD